MFCSSSPQKNGTSKTKQFQQTIRDLIIMSSGINILSIFFHHLNHLPGGQKIVNKENHLKASFNWQKNKTLNKSDTCQPFWHQNVQEHLKCQWGENDTLGVISIKVIKN